MRLIDMHCDTVFELFRRRNTKLKPDVFCAEMESAQNSLHGDMDLGRNSLCVDLGKMKKADSVAQFFACFIYMKMFQGEGRFSRGYQYALDMIAFAKNEIGKYPEEIALVKSYEEFLKCESLGKIAAFLTVEEGGVVEGDLNRLDRLYEEGIRLMTLLWNEENCMGYPNSRDGEVMKKGLKPFGIETVERMNELGMLIDVSHMSDGGFWDVLRYSKKPVVASHSNARTLCNHPRNLTDEMIRALSDHGGVAGLNLYPYFINENGKANIDDLIRHIEHMFYVGGEDFVAIGADFDGFDEGELELQNIGEMRCLYDALKKRKFNDGQIEKFWNGNAMRVIREVL